MPHPASDTLAAQCVGAKLSYNHKGGLLTFSLTAMPSIPNSPHRLSDITAQTNQCLSPHYPQGCLPHAVLRHVGLLSQTKTLPPSCQPPLPAPPLPISPTTLGILNIFSQHISALAN